MKPHPKSVKVEIPLPPYRPWIFSLAFLIPCLLLFALFQFSLFPKYRHASSFLVTQLIISMVFVSLFSYYVEIFIFKKIVFPVVIREALHYFFGINAGAEETQMIGSMISGADKMMQMAELMGFDMKTVTNSISVSSILQLFEDVKPMLALLGIRTDVSGKDYAFLFRPKMIAVILFAIYIRATVEEEAKWYLSSRYRETKLFRRAAVDLRLWILSGAVVGFGFGIVEGVSLTVVLAQLHSRGISTTLILSLIVRLIAAVMVNVATQMTAAAAATRQEVMGDRNVIVSDVRSANVLIHGTSDLMFLLSAIAQVADFSVQKLVLFVSIDVGVVLLVAARCWLECHKVFERERSVADRYVR